MTAPFGLGPEFAIDVHLLHVASTARRVYRTTEYEPFSDYIWDEGNYACDCNRATFWARAVDPSHSAGGEVCGEGAFRVERIVRVDTGETIYSEEPST